METLNWMNKDDKKEDSLWFLIVFPPPACNLSSRSLPKTSCLFESLKPVFSLFRFNCKLKWFASRQATVTTHSSLDQRSSFSCLVIALVERNSFEWRANQARLNFCRIKTLKFESDKSPNRLKKNVPLSQANNTHKQMHTDSGRCSRCYSLFRYPMYVEPRYYENSSNLHVAGLACYPHQKLSLH